MSDPSAGTAAGQIYTSETNGDWGTASIWSTDSVPDSSTADVTIDNNVTIETSETYTAGLADIAPSSSVGAAPPSGLTVDGSLDVTEYLTVEDGGFLFLDGGSITGSVDNSGVISVGFGLNYLAGPVMGTGSIGMGNGAFEGSVLELGQGSDEDVTFAGGGGLLGEAHVALQLDDPDAYTGTIYGFTPNGQTIVLSGFAADTLSDTFSGRTISGKLTISDAAGTVASLNLAGDYTDSTFELVAVSPTETAIVVHNVPCFTRGTRLATPRGNVAVEHLHVGERVLNSSGETRPVIWIGNRRVDCARHPRPELVRPVRVRAGAFGALPRRDLLLSPDHSVYAEGVLIPVKYLINGITVAQEPAAEVHYFHVELETHDVLLAEGLPAESYLDTGNRAQFAIAEAATALHPDFAARTWENACAPLATDGPAVLAVRRRLLARSAGLGWARRAEPQFAVLADGAAVRPETISGKLHRWVLPTGTREARIASSTAVPAGLGLAATDCRTLGARIGAVLVDEDFVPLDHPALAAGFHPIEGFGAVRWRWTDGCAVLALPPGHGPRILELLVRDVMAGWQEAAAPALAA